MSTLKPIPFRVFETNRLTLRQLTDDDSQAIFELRTSESVNKYIQRKVPADMTEAIAFINRINAGINNGTALYWAIFLNSNPVLIGTVCLWNFADNNAIAELGYEMNSLYQGKGYMTEAVNCVTDYAFGNLGVTCLEAFTHRDNANSIKLLEKNGFALNEGKVDDDNLNNIVFFKNNPNTVMAGNFAGNK